MANPAPVAPPAFVAKQGNGFQPGISGNPAGPPQRVKLVSNAMYELLQKDNPTNAVQVAEAIVLKAKTGDTFAIKELLDRVEGKVPTPIQLDARTVTLEVQVLYSDLLSGAQDTIRASLLGQAVAGQVTESDSETQDDNVT